MILSLIKRSLQFVLEKSVFFELLKCIDYFSRNKSLNLNWHLLRNQTIPSSLKDGIVFVRLSHVQLFVTPWTGACTVPCPSQSARIGSNSCLLSQCCYLTISSSATCFSSCPQSFPASGSFLTIWLFASVSQSVSSMAQSCPTLCNPMNRTTPGLPVHHQLPEFTHTHVHRVSDAIQASDPLLSPSPPAPNPSQHQSLFQ